MADPDRLGTVMSELAGVTLVCWLMGSATRPPPISTVRDSKTLLERLGRHARARGRLRGGRHRRAGAAGAGAAAVAGGRGAVANARRGGRGGSGRPRVLGRRDEGGGRAAALEQGARERQRERCHDEHDRDDEQGRSSQPRGQLARRTLCRSRLAGSPAAGSGPARSRPARALPAARRPATARRARGDPGNQGVRGLDQTALVLDAARAVAQVHVEARLVAGVQRAVEAIGDQALGALAPAAAGQRRQRAPQLLRARARDSASSAASMPSRSATWAGGAGHAGERQRGPIALTEGR